MIWGAMPSLAISVATVRRMSWIVHGMVSVLDADVRRSLYLPMPEMGDVPVVVNT